MRNTRNDRVRLVAIADPVTRLQPGDEGWVIVQDSAGTVHVRWDNGSRLGLCYDDGDRWETLSPEPAPTALPLPELIAVRKDDGSTVEPGRVVRDFRGRDAVLVRASRANGPAKDGKVEVRYSAGGPVEQCYASVVRVTVHNGPHAYIPGYITWKGCDLYGCGREPGDAVHAMPAPAEQA